MNQNVTSRDKEIIDAMRNSGHNIISEPEIKVQKELKQEVPSQQVTPPAAKEKIKQPEPVIENLILRKLEKSFGINQIESKIIDLNGVAFTLSPVDADLVTWASAAALSYVINEQGQYNIPEYQAKLEVFLAGCYVSAIDGQPIQEVFSGTNERDTRFKFVSWLLKKSSDNLAKRIFDKYDELIEPNAKILSGADNEKASNLKMFQCPTCSYVTSFKERPEPYYCQKDGTMLAPYKMEGNNPLA